ncbi:MAG TPA: protein kinase [Candidatus Thermoplasmatota archaeon]|nr:protein kinase [Candidatus Thermoplasmatota archaeon]
MVSSRLPPKDKFAGRTVKNWQLKGEVGRGKIGVVYRALQPDLDDEVAIKLIPMDNLKAGWKAEIAKLVKLGGVPQVIQFRTHEVVEFDGVLYVAIISEFIRGSNLKEYAAEHPGSITLSFVENLAEQVLRVFVAMAARGISHGDLHEGNVMIAVDDRHFEPDPVIKVGDFGIGGTHNVLKPKDDYSELAAICLRLLERYVDPAALDDAQDRQNYEYFLGEFITKRLLERNPTVGDHVRDPRRLLTELRESRAAIQRKALEKPAKRLRTPFEYLSSEQIGDSFELLQRLYSSNFPGYEYILERTNTILTGPRGCGKTTIFRNLSLKAQLISGKVSASQPPDYIGIYYHCRDLYFTFHFLKERATDAEREILTHYVNLALLREVLDTLVLAENESRGKWDTESLRRLQDHITEWLPKYQVPPTGTPVLRHLLSFIEKEKHSVGLWLKQGRRGAGPGEYLLPRDFMPGLCNLLQQIVPWMKNRPVFFFLDDYSLPHVSKPVQQTLNDFVMERWPECFFKISTESLTTFHPYDASGKLVEETREYDVVDLAAHFNASDERRAFLVEILNNRLNNAEGIHPEYKDIVRILGESPFPSYNELARQIRRTEGAHRVQYSGIGVLSDLFSGDIADILRIVSAIFSNVGTYEVFSSPGGVSLPIGPDKQDKAIRAYGASFLNRVEAAPQTGPYLRKIAEAFGNSSNYILRNRTSKNEASSPPWQAFRIEIRERLTFDEPQVLGRAYDSLVPKDKRKEISLETFRNTVEARYFDLIRYGVFLRDARGKSQRGAVVPRLYLRRLLIPTFLLTPSQRDSLGLEVHQFITLLYDPDEFIKQVREKIDRAGWDPNDVTKQARISEW